jgi:hypothetical protein
MACSSRVRVRLRVGVASHGLQWCSTAHNAQRRKRLEILVREGTPGGGVLTMKHVGFTARM